MAVTVYGIRRATHDGSNRPLISSEVYVGDADAMIYGSATEAARQRSEDFDEFMTEGELRATEEGRTALAAHQRGDRRSIDDEGKAEREAIVRQTT